MAARESCASTRVEVWRCPRRASRDGQHLQAVFYHDEEQREIAEAMRAELIEAGKKWCRHTAIEPAKDFWQAEE